MVSDNVPTQRIYELRPLISVTFTAQLERGLLVHSINSLYVRSTQERQCSSASEASTEVVTFGQIKTSKLLDCKNLIYQSSLPVNAPEMSTVLPLLLLLFASESGS